MSEPHVIIVGAGVIGCACAFELASTGARVSVFDVRRVGLGASQVILCGLLMTGAAILLGFPPATAFIAAMGFTMTSTAVVIQLLTERGEVAGIVSFKLLQAEGLSFAIPVDLALDTLGVRWAAAAAP